jgi:uncharacterized protein YdhG (YjbR/CyaY superfamily)
VNDEVRRYIDAIPATHRPLFDSLQALIFELHPDAEMLFSYKLPTYKVGKKRVYLGTWKGGVSIHAVAVDPFKAKHPAIKTGKGSINFKFRDELPEDDVREVIREALEGGA